MVTTTEATTETTRLPFVPAEADALVAFCAAHGPYDGALARRLLLELTSDPAGVIVLAGGEACGGDASGGALLAVAAVIDRALNGADAANLELLAARRPLSARELAHLVVEPGLAFARTGPCRALHVTLRPSLLADGAGAVEALRARGFTSAYESFSMRCRLLGGAPGTPPAAPPLPGGWRWAALDDDARIAEAHTLLSDAFAGAPSFNLSPLPDFRRMAAARATTWRLLLDGEALAGLVQVAAAGARGELRTVARVPRYRGQALGPRLVAEGLRLLAAAGAREIDLDVEARNEQALSLYRRHGFEVASRVPVLAYALR